MTMFWGDIDTLLTISDFLCGFAASCRGSEAEPIEQAYFGIRPRFRISYASSIHSFSDSEVVTTCDEGVP